jgi:hypothetical protein
VPEAHRIFYNFGNGFQNVTDQEADQAGSSWKKNFAAASEQKKLPVLKAACVENTGVEPVTSCMPCKRSSQLS